jgi:4a-hydroxytetrahydrobiopterin dehydratase
MKADEAALYQKDVPGWKIAADGTKISRQFPFEDFKAALAFVNEVGKIAEEQGHHPDIALGYGKAGIELSTHAVGGLTPNDFIMAAKIDKLA